MKIAYLIHCNFEDNFETSGVYKKIVHQINIWKNLGNEIAVFHITSKEFKQNVDILKSWFVFKYNRGSLLERINAFKSAIDKIIEWSPDIVYYRYDLWYPSIYKLSKNFPLVLEINTNDVKEFSINHSKFGFMYLVLTRRFTLMNASGIVFVTNELANSKYFNFNKPYVVIGNGIDLNLYEDYRKKIIFDDKIRIGFIGSEGQIWHGVDKIINLAKIKKDWEFHIIGISENFGLQNVYAYGKMSLHEYLPILQSCDVAFGSLALHRKKMNEASPLKVREYLAIGLPVIIGYKDTDFPDKVDFILELPNCEDNVLSNINDIEKFVNYWKGRRINKEDILHIDWNAKEKKRLEFFKKILEENIRKKKG